MPSTTTKRSVDRASVSSRGWRRRRAPAPPGILDSVPADLRRELPDEVVDDLLAGARRSLASIGTGLGAGATHSFPEAIQKCHRWPGDLRSVAEREPLSPESMAPTHADWTNLRSRRCAGDAQPLPMH